MMSVNREQSEMEILFQEILNSPSTPQDIFEQRCNTNIRPIPFNLNQATDNVISEP